MNISNQIPDANLLRGLEELSDALPALYKDGPLDAYNATLRRFEFNLRMAWPRLREIAKTQPQKFAETVACDHVSPTDFVVVRLHMCHACIERIKQSEAKVTA